MLFWALLASGEINMRKVDGWQTLATVPSNSRSTSAHDRGPAKWGVLDIGPVPKNAPAGFLLARLLDPRAV
jgi:hypothetical protein